jgi:hypothetical protein
VNKPSSCEHLSHFFNLPLSEVDFQQFQNLELLSDIQLEDANDIWGTTIPTQQQKLMGPWWDSISTTFPSNGCGNPLASPSTVSFWLLLKDRSSKRNILRRKSKFLESYSCVLYQNDVEETRDHLFLNCPFAIACWGLLCVDFTAPR